MNPWIRIAGWTLVHFAWQGAVIALTAVVALRLLRTASAQARYAVACAALTGMLVSPVITARVLSASATVRIAQPIKRVVFFRHLGDDSGAEPLLREFNVQTPPGILEPPTPLGLAAFPQVLDSFSPMLVAVWLAGVAFFVIRLAGGWWRVRRLHRTSLAVAKSRWQPVAKQLASRLHLDRAVHVVDSVLVNTPTVLGWWRPIVLLPVAALANLSPAQVESILAHELAHIRRHDYLVNLLQTVAETLLFYHPAVWWVSARIRTEREHCCDDVAVAVCGDAVGYAEALAELETWRMDVAARTTAASLALAATDGSLLERVRRVLRARGDDPRRSLSAAPTVALVFLFVVVAGGLISLPRLQATDAGSTADGVGRQAKMIIVERRIINADERRVLGLRQSLQELPALGESQRQPVLRVRLGQAARQPGVPGAPAQSTAATSAGQSTSSAVSGSVRDATGVVVPGASVVLSDLESSANRTAQTDDQGRFQFMDVTPTQYVLQVTTPWSEPISDRIAVFSRQTLERAYVLQVRGVTMGTRLTGPRPARPATPRALPNGWTCAEDRPTFCGPPSLVQEFRNEIRAQRANRSQAAVMTKMWDGQYPQSAWDAKIEGTAVVEGRINADGVPTGLRVTAPVYPDLATAAIEAVSAARFEPARLNGVAVEVPLTVTIEFRLHQ